MGVHNYNHISDVVYEWDYCVKLKMQSTKCKWIKEKKHEAIGLYCPAWTFIVAIYKIYYIFQIVIVYQ